MDNLRRIVTGHDEQGKSIIMIDGGPSRTIGEDVGGLFEIWNTDGKKIDSLDNRDRADIEIILSPEANGTKFRYFEIQPTPENIPRDGQAVLTGVPGAHPRNCDCSSAGLQQGM